MSIPLGDGGKKKFNWASELSTYITIKPTVVYDGGLFVCNNSFYRRSLLVPIAVSDEFGSSICSNCRQKREASRLKIGNFYDIFDVE